MSIESPTGTENPEARKFLERLSKAIVHYAELFAIGVLRIVGDGYTRREELKTELDKYEHDILSGK